MKPGLVLPLAALAAGLMACGRTAAAATEAQRAACPPMREAGGAIFRGGTANGEEITVQFDPAAATYRVEIDAGRTASRRSIVRKGRLKPGGRACAYLLSGGGHATPVGLSAAGVLVGRIAGTAAGVAPVAFIAFRHTSDRLADLAGRWHVSGRERAIDAALPSQPIARYELRMRPDGRFDKCMASMRGRSIRCAGGGRITSDGTAFRLQEGTAAGDDSGTTLLILGRAGDSLVPILLKRDATGQGLRILTQRKAGKRN